MRSMVTKPGRNDPCYCGSGKKYKRCCLDSDDLPGRHARAAAASVFAAVAAPREPMDESGPRSEVTVGAVIPAEKAETRVTPAASARPASERSTRAPESAGSVDIDRFTEAELIELNQRIVARVRFLRRLATHSTMREFRIGERVTFHPEGRPRVVGMVTRYNQKTVTVITDDGQRWNVAPQLLERAGSRVDDSPESVVAIQPKR